MICRAKYSVLFIASLLVLTLFPTNSHAKSLMKETEESFGAASSSEQFITPEKSILRGQSHSEDDLTEVPTPAPTELAFFAVFKNLFGTAKPTNIPTASPIDSNDDDTVAHQKHFKNGHKHHHEPKSDGTEDENSTDDDTVAHGKHFKNGKVHHHKQKSGEKAEENDEEAEDETHDGETEDKTHDVSHTHSPSSIPGPRPTESKAERDITNFITVEKTNHPTSEPSSSVHNEKL